MVQFEWCSLSGAVRMLMARDTVFAMLVNN